MSWSVAEIPDQSGRTAVVTGANAGLGEQIALALSLAGAHVVLACRDQTKAVAAAERIRASAPSAAVEVAALDLADLGSVAAFADGFAARHDRLDLLINNAGLMAIDRARTADGFEMQLGVNHLGHFAVTGRLLPMLLDTTGSRVATMSSMGHRAGRLQLDDLMFERRPYRRWDAYFQSKLANLLFTAELQRRLTASGAKTIAVTAHPGAANTDLGFEGNSLANRLMPLLVHLGAQPARLGAVPMLRAATDPGVRGGEFHGPRFVVRGRAPVRERPSGRARDAVSARGLWAESERLVGLTYPG